MQIQASGTATPRAAVRCDSAAISARLGSQCRDAVGYKLSSSQASSLIGSANGIAKREPFGNESGTATAFPLSFRISPPRCARYATRSSDKACTLNSLPPTASLHWAAELRACLAVCLAKHRGQTVVVVGHSNTVPDIVAALGAARPPAICDAEYDNLYVVRVPVAGAATVERRRYGAPMGEEGGCRGMR